VKHSPYAPSPNSQEGAPDGPIRVTLLVHSGEGADGRQRLGAHGEDFRGRFSEEYKQGR
jgi:hypothetical protein